MDDQQNVNPVCFPLIGCELHFSGIRRRLEEEFSEFKSRIIFPVLDEEESNSRS